MKVWLEYSHTSFAKDSYKVISRDGNEPTLIHTSIGVAVFWEPQRGKIVTRVWTTVPPSHTDYEHTDRAADKADLDWALEVVIQKLVERRLS